jgi:hypothetical protein
MNGGLSHTYQAYIWNPNTVNFFSKFPIELLQFSYIKNKEYAILHINIFIPTGPTVKIFIQVQWIVTQVFDSWGPWILVFYLRPQTHSKKFYLRFQNETSSLPLPPTHPPSLQYFPLKYEEKKILKVFALQNFKFPATFYMYSL